PTITASDSTKPGTLFTLDFPNRSLKPSPTAPCSEIRGSPLASAMPSLYECSIFLGTNTGTIFSFSGSFQSRRKRSSRISPATIGYETPNARMSLLYPDPRYLISAWRGILSADTGYISFTPSMVLILCNTLSSIPGLFGSFNSKRNIDEGWRVETFMVFGGMEE